MGCALLNQQPQELLCFLEVFTALAGYKHLVSNLSRVVIHHSVDVQGWLAL